MDRVKSDTTLSFSFADPSPALEALLGQGTVMCAPPQPRSEAEEGHTMLSTDSVKHRRVSVQADNSSRHGGEGIIGVIPRRDSSDSARSQTPTYNRMPTTPEGLDDNPPPSAIPGAIDLSGVTRGISTPVVAGQAAKLKRKFSVAMGQNPSGTMKVLAEHDPENHEIKRLRERGYKWSEIAEKVNKQRVAAGKVPGLTDNAVYSRYTRNAPRIAAAQGEVWDPKTVGPHPSKKTEPMAPITGFNDLEDQRLVESYAEIQKETWELVSDRIVAKGGKRHDPELCARRYQSI